MDRTELIAFAQQLGLHAFARDWGMGKTICLLDQRIPSEDGLEGYERGAWIVDDGDA